MIEINRSLYMNEETGAKVDGFARIMHMIRAAVKALRHD